MVWVGRDLTDHLLPPPTLGKDPFPQPRVLRAPSSLALNPAREGAATAPLGSLDQGLATLRGKSLFSLKPLPLVLSLHALVRSPSPALWQTLQVPADCCEGWRGPPPRVLPRWPPTLSSCFSK